MEDERCRSAILGLSALDFRDTGLRCGSDSELLEAIEEELEDVGDKLGRTVWSRKDVTMVGSG